MEKVKSPSKETIVKNLINSALSEVATKYGIGQGDGRHPKKYHNLIHAQGVIFAAQQIAQSSLEAGKITVSDLPLVEIAAAFHDLEQDLGSGPNEKSSAQIAAEKMRESELFSENDIQKVTTMILATTTHFENGVIKQSVTAEGDYLSQILADADLSALGRESTVYWQKTLDLLKEIKFPATLSTTDIVSFTELQLTLLSHHQFYTAEAAKLFPHQQQNLHFASQQLNLLV